ncbi:MAG: hypothetical protein QOF01_4692 [Thermomicrobiales bacterium]|jgi:hypothetical protein|nr:hypothetical protein [Thermomicrobiales bacterium]MEA2524128.1 hypothetical protein [Thermomicrobiales bacterium]MEA2598223.1 hypothetical protein [Thermomicrobiales bacterium]
MMRKTILSNAIRGTHCKALKTLRAVGASTLLTMRLFEILPEPDTRPRTAIVRELAQTGKFDPRELLPNGMVLTLPLNADATQRTHRFVEIGPN